MIKLFSLRLIITIDTMTKFPPLHVKSSNMMNDFLFCQVIDDAKDDLDTGVLTTTTMTNDNTSIQTQGGKAIVPVRSRVTTPTSTTEMQLTIPLTDTTQSTTSKTQPFFPPPPPMFANGMVGGRSTASSPASLVDPLTKTSFHPDFMFCGACTDCEENDGEGSTPVLSNGEFYNDDYESNSDSESNSIDSSDTTKSFLRTTFQLGDLQRPQQQQNRHNEILVLRSLIRAIPGVRKVSIPSSHNTVHTLRSSSALNSENIIVHHDASVLTGTIRHAFESAGYSASIRNSASTPGTATTGTATTNLSNNFEGKSDLSNFGTVLKEKGPLSDVGRNNNNQTICWVRSDFDVQGICCTSEIPAIRRIVKPLLGVAKVNINLTTKIVHVQHNYVQIQASHVAQALTEQGFPALVRKDGGAMVQFAKNDKNYTNSNGNNINNNDQQANIILLADTLDRMGKSSFVESTLMVEGLRPDQGHWIEKAIADSFIRVQVRAVYPSAISETIKVEHSPDLVSIKDIRDFLRRNAINNNGSSRFPSSVEVYIDGGDTNLYLPSVDDYPNQSVIHRDHGGCFSWMKRHHVNVMLSGIFWILSMVSIVDGMDRFKYFGLASVFFGLPPIVLKAYRTLRRCQFDANCMMVTAAFGALALGEYDEAASVSFLFAVSEFLEARASTKARKALSEICALRPDHANVIHPISKDIVVVPADRVPLGSMISVRTGDKIAADGVVIEGSTSIDESSLTGESTPVHKHLGDEVSGGTINIGQTHLVVRTTTTVDDSAVSRLIRLVEEAQSNRSPTEMMVDSFARSYTPSVIVIAAIMCTIPWYFGTDIGRQWTLNGLIIVVIACPCALTISTPVTYAAGLAASAKRGIIIKGGAKLEAMGSVDCVVFDKTGTLTKGKFSVIHMNVIGASKTRQEMLELLSLMQERASHPIASSLVQAAKNEGVTAPRQMAVADHQILKGEGITAKIDGQLQVYVGNQRLFNRLGMFDLLSSSNKNLVKEWEESGGTIGFIGCREDGIIGMFCVKDSVREEARQALDELKKTGIEAYMCTGDSEATAQAVAKEIGMLGHCVNSELLPEDKLRFVEGLMHPEPKELALCRKKRYVLFCGDGVNDAPALAAVDIGVSMGEGAAMALEMSDVTLMDSRLTKLPYVIKMGQRVLKTVKENIIISFVAKFAVVLLTFMGKMTLLYAITADVGVMLLVTLNGMKLLPNDHFELMGTRFSSRGREIAKQKNGLGKDTDFELVRMESVVMESVDSLNPSISEIV